MFVHIELNHRPGVPVWEEAHSDDYYELRSSHGFLRLKKRAAYPGAYLERREDGYHLGYGSRQPEPSLFYDEFLRLGLHTGPLRLEVLRDVFCTLPLFYRMGPDGVVISDDMSKVITPAAEVDKTALVALLLEPHIADETLFAGISLLGERMHLSWRPGNLVAQKSPLPSLADVPADPKRFKTALEETLEGYLDRAAGTVMAFEASGGIDSATLPLFAAKRGIAAPLACMEFPDTFGTSQRSKLTDLAGRTGGRLISTPVTVEHHYPLGRLFAPRFQPQPFYQYQEIYTEALDALASQLQAEGTEVIFTGIGGDELFENNPATTPRLTSLRPAFYTDRVQTLQLREDERTLLANSAYYAGQSRNAIYLAHGIWPLSPLSDPALYGFTQSLGIEHRDNKNILRAYHQAIGSPESIFRPVQNEHFGHFFEDALKHNYARVLSALKEDSWLLKNGWVDWRHLERTYEEACYRENRHELLFAIYRLASAEAILRSV